MDSACDYQPALFEFQVRARTIARSVPPRGEVISVLLLTDQWTKTDRVSGL
jgi:hypothetical protein